jgi:hypothetical protein
VQTFKGTKENPAVVRWPGVVPKEAVNKVFPPLPAELRVRPVYKKQARRLVANRCVNCKYVSAQSAQGKQWARWYARHTGLQISSAIVGFLVPWPFSLAANTLVCGAISVGYDAHEYREDYKEEPSQEQYNKSFGSNLLYCSPIGGFIAAIENRNPIQFLLAGLGFSGYFVNLPPAVGYVQQGLPLVQYATTSRQQAAVAAKQPPVKHR